LEKQTRLIKFKRRGLKVTVGGLVYWMNPVFNSSGCTGLRLDLAFGKSLFSSKRVEKNYFLVIT